MALKPEPQKELGRGGLLNATRHGEVGMSLFDGVVTLPRDSRNQVIPTSIDVTLASLARRDYRIAAPSPPSESFGRQFDGFLRECWRGMKVMKVAFEAAEHLPT
jgi:hypothetical protein